MKEEYGVGIRFHKRSLELIAKCDVIVNEYVAQGFRLTIRQLYYQLVARGHIENTMQSYNNVQALMTNARLAGLIDWDAIEDRTRGFIDFPSWSSGADILRACAGQYHEDMWADQETRIFVVVEKEALAGVLERVCKKWDCPLLPARGYPSASTLREFAKERIMGATRQIVVLHLGDHDPSGIDMTRDLCDRLALFTRDTIEINFKRIALNMDQIEEVNPPANPAKQTDARFEAYRAQFGDESWELDALSPTYIHELVERNVLDYVDPDIWQSTTNRIAAVRARIKTIADNFKDPV
jgi:DNA topoisomerase VI subunit A